MQHYIWVSLVIENERKEAKKSETWPLTLTTTKPNPNHNDPYLTLLTLTLIILTLTLLTNRTLKAKFHYASWFEAGLKLVRSWFEAGSNQLRTNFEPASVMEFSFKLTLFRELVASLYLRFRNRTVSVLVTRRAAGYPEGLDTFGLISGVFNTFFSLG